MTAQSASALAGAPCVVTGSRVSPAHTTPTPSALPAHAQSSAFTTTMHYAKRGSLMVASENVRSELPTINVSGAPVQLFPRRCTPHESLARQRGVLLIKKYVARRPSRRGLRAFARLHRPCCAWSASSNVSMLCAKRGSLTNVDENVRSERLTVDISGTPVQHAPRRRTLANLMLESALYTCAAAEKPVFSSSTSMQRARLRACDSVREHPLVEVTKFPLYHMLYPRAMRRSIARRRGRVR